MDQPHVRWVAVEERAEGGDAIYQRSKQFAGFLKGFERVAEAACSAQGYAVKVFETGAEPSDGLFVDAHGAIDDFLGADQFPGLAGTPRRLSSRRQSGNGRRRAPLDRTAVPSAEYRSRKMVPSEKSTNSPDSV